MGLVRSTNLERSSGAVLSMTFALFTTPMRYVCGVKEHEMIGNRE